MYYLLSEARALMVMCVRSGGAAAGVRCVRPRRLPRDERCDYCAWFVAAPCASLAWSAAGMGGRAGGSSRGKLSSRAVIRLARAARNWGSGVGGRWRRWTQQVCWVRVRVVETTAAAAAQHGELQMLRWWLRWQQQKAGVHVVVQVAGDARAVSWCACASG